MSGLVIFKGKYGATSQYAKWVAEELQLPVSSADHVDREVLSKSDFIVIGSSVYIGRMLIGDWMKANAKILQNKMIYLFVVCGMPPSDKAVQQHFIQENIPPLLINNSYSFFLPGRLIWRKLSWKDRILLKMGARFEKDPAKKKAMLADIDQVKRPHLFEMLAFIRSMTLRSDGVVEENVPVYGSD